MKKVKALILKLHKDEEGSGFITMTPFFILIFILLTALVLSVGLWNLKRQQVKMMADTAARAGTLAVLEQIPVLESNGKYHLYTKLDPVGACSNALEVLNAWDTTGIRIDGYAFNPVEGYVREHGNTYQYYRFTSPEWSSYDHQYHESLLDEEEQYHNGDFSVFLSSTIDGVWEDLLGLGGEHSFDVYSQSHVSGTVTKH